MAAVQYTYFAAIYASNAATSHGITIHWSRYDSCVSCYALQKNTSIFESIAIVLAITGTFLLVTHGSLQSLSMSGKAFFWGIFYRQ